jgi:hypothetical protein
MPTEPCRYKPPQFVTVSVKVFKKCRKPDFFNDSRTEFETKDVDCLKGEEAKTKLLFERIANSEALQCTPVDAIASVPDWWQVRIEGNRPQLVVHFSEKDLSGNLSSAKYVITIPHPPANKPIYSPIGSYTKGNVEGILTLKDNSKLIVNALNAAEAERVIDEAIRIIDPAMLVSSFSKIGTRRGQPIKEITVYPCYARFFSTGYRNQKPDWTIYFL